jgi:hypothetical protein
MASLFNLIVATFLLLWVMAVIENTKEVRKMALQLDELAKALRDNTAAVNAAVAAGIGQGTSAADQMSIDNATAQINANTAALVAATPVTQTANS